MAVVRSHVVRCSLSCAVIFRVGRGLRLIEDSVILCTSTLYNAGEFVKDVQITIGRRNLFEIYFLSVFRLFFLFARLEY